MNTTTLRPIPASVTFNSGYINKTETNLTIQLHDRFIKNASITDTEGQTLFTLETKSLLTSWSVRRKLYDASGHHILDVRHHNSKLNEWVVEDPDGKNLSIVRDGTDPATKATALQARVVSDDVACVEIRSFDRAGTKTVIRIGDAVIAEMNLTDNNDVYFLRGMVRAAWTLRVAAGVDLAMVLGLLFCRAEVFLAWRR